LLKVVLLIGNFQGLYDGGFEFGALLGRQIFFPFHNIAALGNEIPVQFLFGHLPFLLDIVG